MTYLGRIKIILHKWRGSWCFVVNTQEYEELTSQQFLFKIVPIVLFPHMLVNDQLQATKFSSLSLENLGNCIYNMQTYKEK